MAMMKKHMSKMTATKLQIKTMMMMMQLKESGSRFDHMVTTCVVYTVQYSLMVELLPLMDGSPGWVGGGGVGGGSNHYLISVANQVEREGVLWSL